jgi:hypothetical protein
LHWEDEIVYTTTLETKQSGLIEFAVDANGIYFWREISSIELIYSNDFSIHMINITNYSQKRGLTGGHNLVNFNNYLVQNNIEIQRISLTESSINGISELTYQIRKADGSGEWKSTYFKKTLYNPSIISDEQMIQYGKEAMIEGLSNNRIISQENSNTIIKGQSINGIKFIGYQEPITKEIVNFHPVINY